VRTTGTVAGQKREVDWQELISGLGVYSGRVTGYSEVMDFSVEHGYSYLGISSRERRASVPKNCLTNGFTLGFAKQARPWAKTVPESDAFMPLGLALSEKQIPQITENTEKAEE
jgi:hypothetical protein